MGTLEGLKGSRTSGGKRERRIVEERPKGCCSKRVERSHERDLRRLARQGAQMPAKNAKEQNAMESEAP